MKKIDISKFQSLIGLIVFSVIVAFINSRFMTTSNILNILRQTSINAVIATGMTFVILTGGIDLSVGSILGFSGAVAAMMLASGVNSIIAIPVALIVGLVVGALNGVLISKGIPILEIANMYGVHKDTIKDIKKGKTWKH